MKNADINSPMQTEEDHLKTEQDQPEQAPQNEESIAIEVPKENVTKDEFNTYFFRLSVCLYSLLPNLLTFYALLSITGVSPVHLSQDTKIRYYFNAIMIVQVIWLVLMIIRSFYLATCRATEGNVFYLTASLEEMKERYWFKILFVLVSLVSLGIEIMIWRIFLDDCKSETNSTESAEVCSDLSSTTSFVYTVVMALVGLLTVWGYDGAYHEDLYYYRDNEIFLKLKIPTIKLLGLLQFPIIWYSTSDLLSSIGAMVALKVNADEKDDDDLKEQYSHLKWEWIANLNKEDIKRLALILPTTRKTSRKLTIHSKSKGSSLGKDECIKEGESLVSNNKKYYATLRPDGHFLVYRGYGWEHQASRFHDNIKDHKGPYTLEVTLNENEKVPVARIFGQALIDQKFVRSDVGKVEVKCANENQGWKDWELRLSDERGELELVPRT